MILAEQLPTGEVRYISLERYARDGVTHILKTFYSKAERVTALIDLGNLYQLAPSPYGKYRFEVLDEVHCIANIRDQRESKGRNAAKYATMEELTKMKYHKFLYRDGAWHFYDGEEFTTDLPAVIPDERRNSLRDLELRTFSDKDEIVTMDIRNYGSWAALEARSAETQKPIFIFRGNKLITTINHPKNI